MVHASVDAEKSNSPLALKGADCSTIEILPHPASRHAKHNQIEINIWSVKILQGACWNDFTGGPWTRDYENATYLAITGERFQSIVAFLSDLSSPRFCVIVLFQL
jgi:hypothetical protein